MHLTRCSVILGSILSLPLIACGGDDGGGGGGGGTPDAKVFMDAAPDTAAACAVPASFAGGTLGSDAMRQSDDWIKKTTQNQQTITYFTVSIPVDMTQKNFLTLVAIKGTDWTIGTPINFATSPTQQGASALAYIDENLNLSDGSSDRTLWASSGSITFTEIAQTAGSKITFSTTAANFREIDDQGADVPGGCTSMAGAVQVFLQQKTTVNLLPPDEGGLDALHKVAVQNLLH